MSKKKQSIIKRGLLFGLGLIVFVAGAYFSYLYYQRISFAGKVCLVSLGKVEKADLLWIKQQIEQFYHFKVTLLPPEDLPTEAFYKPRNRYKAGRLLTFLSTIKPGGQDKIIGFTQQDISTSVKGHSDWGVIGLAWLHGTCCVVSTFRLKRDHPSQRKFKERLAKVALHEIGHTLGLEHCTNSEYCMMNDATGSIKTIDRERIELCESCREKIAFTQN